MVGQGCAPDREFFEGTIPWATAAPRLDALFHSILQRTFKGDR